MAILGKSRILTPLIAVSAIALLSGCVGTSTYGTGKTQEAQLLEDVSSLVMVGPSEKKEKIDYSARPKLVKPAAVDALPAPVEEVQDENAFFPEDPETRRSRLLAAATGGDTAAEQQLMADGRAEYELRQKSSTSAGVTLDQLRGRNEVKPELARRQRAAFLKAKAERDGAIGAAPRKYLTEPPRDYRTPYETAAVGNVGIPEADKEYKKKGGSLLSKLNPFD